MLKIKKLVNYRQAKISVDGRDRNCGHCARRNLIDIYGIPPFPGGGKLLGQDYRCTEIGLNASRWYFVAANHICDRFIRGEK